MIRLIVSSLDPMEWVRRESTHFGVGDLAELTVDVQQFVHCIFIIIEAILMVSILLIQ